MTAETHSNESRERKEQNNCFTKQERQLKAGATKVVEGKFRHEDKTIHNRTIGALRF